MSMNPTKPRVVSTLEIPANYPSVPAEHLPSSERLENNHLDLPAPSPEHVGVFFQLLRSDTAEASEHRLISPETAYNVLLDQLNKAREVRAQFNNPDRSNGIIHISDQQRLAAYYQGVDAYAGMIALTPSFIKDSAFAEFQEWSAVAASLARRVEVTKAPSYSLAITPATLENDPAIQASVRANLKDVEQFERIYAYERAAKSGTTDAVREAFTGADASRLARAQALFEYAHTGISQDQPQLKIQSLSEVVDVLQRAVADGPRPHDDDLVGIYNYFMLQSMLGRAIHDIIWLENQPEKTEDDARARRMSIHYLTNAADALDFVKYQAITAHEEPEKALHLDILAFDGVVKNDPTLSSARHTVEYLATGLNELRTAKAAFLNLRDEPWRTPERDNEQYVAQKKVEYLTAKAAVERLEEKIAEQNDAIENRMQTLLEEHHDITDRLLALRSEHIGMITPGSRGRELAKVVLDIDKQLNDARYFTDIYSGEYEPIKNKRFASIMARASILGLLKKLETIAPDSEDLQAPALPQEENELPLAA